jgi:hypothetical protein
MVGRLDGGGGPESLGTGESREGSGGRVDSARNALSGLGTQTRNGKTITENPRVAAATRLRIAAPVEEKQQVVRGLLIYDPRATIYGKWPSVRGQWGCMSTRILLSSIPGPMCSMAEFKSLANCSFTSAQNHLAPKQRTSTTKLLACLRSSSHRIFTSRNGLFSSLANLAETGKPKLSCPNNEKAVWSPSHQLWFILTNRPNSRLPHPYVVLYRLREA